MTKATAAGGSNARLALAGFGILIACLCLGVAGGVAWSYFNSRASASEPAVEYILDASPRMAEAAADTDESRLAVARAVLAEIVRPADGAVSAALRVFGNGALPEACKDTALLVPLAPATQGVISDRLGGVQSGAAADAAMAESMIAAIRDLGAAQGPHTLVVVTGGTDSCNPEAGQLIAQEAERAGIELETFVVGFQVPDTEAAAIRGLVADTPGGTYLEAHDRAGLASILKAIQQHVDAPATTTTESIVATAAALPTVDPGLGLTVEEAGEIVEDEVIVPGLLDHEIIAFPWPEPLDPDDSLLPFAALDLGTPPDPIHIPGPSWFFWIDDFPAGKFAHPSRFVLVDIGTGAVTVSPQQWWPVLNGQGLWVEPADYWNPENWGFQNFEGNPVGFPAARAPGGPPLARPAAAPLAWQAAGRGVALVVNGWQPGESGATPLTLDVASVRAAFAHAGLTTTYLGPAADPNRDGDYTPAALTAWLADQAGTLGSGDTLIIYMTGHGDGTALAGLSPAALEAALRPFSADVHLILILDSSYSGSFIPPLSTQADRLITATDANTPALFDEDPTSDPNGATDTGSEFTSGFVEDWEGILNSPAELASAQQRAIDETRPVWDVLAELSFHSAVAKDAGAQAGKTVPQMVPALQPTPTPTLTPIPSATFTPVPPTATFTPRPPTPTFTPTPLPQPFLTFTVDNAAIGIGQCTILRWDSGNIQSLFLDQRGVVGKGELQVCPSVNTTYTMVANYAGGTLTKQVTVTVSFTTGTVPGAPTFGSYDTAGSEFNDAAGCGPTDVTFYISVNSSPATVTMFYRVVPASNSPTGWSSRPASFSSGSLWSRLLTIADMPAENGTVEVYFTASNSVGTGQSPVYNNVQYHSCKP